MNRAARKVTEELQALPRKEQVEVLRKVLTPGMQLRVAVTQMRDRTRGIPTRVLNRELDRALNEVRREHARRAG